MGNKIWIEDLVREVDAEQRKGPDLDLAKIAERAEQEMERQRLLKKKRKTHIVATAVILVAVLVVSFTTLSLEEGYGDHFRRLFFRANSEDQMNVDNFIDGEDENAYRTEQISLEDIRDLAVFDISLPEYLPEGYALGEIEGIYFFEELTKIVITYENFNSLEQIKYTIAPLEYKKANTVHIDADEEKMKCISDNGIEYQYTDNTKTNVIFWDRDELFYMILGDLTERDLVDMALSVDYEGDKK